MLSQLSELDQKLVEFPVMFCSRVLTSHERNYSPTEGEALAIIFALKRFAHVLYGSRVVIRTDHKPLQFIKGGIEHNRKLSRWWMLLQDFDYRLDYLEGKANVVADCLSRMTNNLEAVPECESLGSSVVPCMALFTQPCSVCMDTMVECDKCSVEFCLDCEGSPQGLPVAYCQQCLKELNPKDPTMDLGLLRLLSGVESSILIAELGVDQFMDLSRRSQKFVLENGILFRVYKDRVCEVPVFRRRKSLMKEIHVVGGHVGSGKMYGMLHKYYYWPDMLQDCVGFVGSCVDCQKEKGVLLQLPLKPTYKYERPFLCWSIDYLPRLPKTTSGFSHVLVCVDVFSKWVELFPMRTKESREVWDVLYSQVFTRFGLPLELRCDRGREFMGVVSVKSEDYGIKISRISVQHPQGNGQAERYVQVVKRSIKTILSSEGWDVTQWDLCIPACLIGLRFFQQRVLGISPFTICTGLSPRLPVKQFMEDDYVGLFGDDQSVQSYVDELVDHIARIRELTVKKLQRADNKNKKYHDGQLQNPVLELQFGDQVLIKNREAGSLLPRLVGPFTFIRYKDRDGYSCILETEDGKQFDCATSHVCLVEDHDSRALVVHR